MGTEGTHLYGDRAPHNLQYVVLVASANLTQERVLTGTANQITVTDGGAGAAVTLSIPADFIVPTTITIPNTGLHILDTGGDHDLIIAPGSDLSADRQLTLTTGDAARTITLSGNPTLDDWFDQSVKVAATPTFLRLALNAGSSYSRIDFIRSDASNWDILRGTGADTLQFRWDTDTKITLGSADVMSELPLKIKEAAAAAADTAAYGQLWVKSDAPNVLMFTDDDGSDFTVDVTAV